MEQALFPICIFAFFGLIFWWGTKQEKKRREGVAAFCAQQGYTFEPRSSTALNQNWSSLPLFQRGKSRQVKNLGSRVEGDKTFSFFDYSFTSGSGKSRQHHLYFVVGRFGDLSLPQFTLGSENIFSKVAQAVGYADIDLPHDPEFSKAFVLRGENEVAVRSLFNTTVTAALKKEKDHGLRIEANAHGIICYGLQGKTEDLQATIQRANSLLELFPGT